MQPSLLRATAGAGRTAAKNVTYRPQSSPRSRNLSRRSCTVWECLACCGTDKIMLPQERQHHQGALL